MSVDLTSEELSALAQMVTSRLRSLKRAREVWADGGCDTIADSPGMPDLGAWDKTIDTYTAILNKLEASHP